MLSINSKTGEVKFSKFQKETEGLDTGSMIIQNYDFSWSDEIRDFIVVEGSKEDRQAYIDSFADDCGVYNVLKKFAKTNDLSLLNRSESFYGDISDLPVDELDPAKYEAAAAASVASLSKVLGEDITAEKLASMSEAELQALIEKVAAAKVAEKQAAASKSEEGE